MVFDLPVLCCKEIWVSPKTRELPSGNLSLTLDLKNFTIDYGKVLSTYFDKAGCLV